MVYDLTGERFGHNRPFHYGACHIIVLDERRALSLHLLIKQACNTSLQIRFDPCYPTNLNVFSLMLQVINLIKPIASVKKLSLSLMLAPEVPVFAVGDEKRFMQTILNIAGNAVKFTKEGYISVMACVARPEALMDPRAPEFYPVLSDGHFYLRVQVDTFSRTHLLYISRLSRFTVINIWALYPNSSIYIDKECDKKKKKKKHRKL